MKFKLGTYTALLLSVLIVYLFVSLCEQGINPLMWEPIAKMYFVTVTYFILISNLKK